MAATSPPKPAPTISAWPGRTIIPLELLPTRLLLRIGQIANAQLIKRAVGEVRDEAIALELLPRLLDLLRRVEIFHGKHGLVLGEQELQVRHIVLLRFGIIAVLVLVLAVEEILLAEPVDDRAVAAVGEQPLPVLRYDQKARLRG